MVQEMAFFLGLNIKVATKTTSNWIRNFEAQSNSNQTVFLTIAHLNNTHFQSFIPVIQQNLVIPLQDKIEFPALVPVVQQNLVISLQDKMEFPALVTQPQLFKVPQIPKPNNERKRKMISQLSTDILKQSKPNPLTSVCKEMASQSVEMKNSTKCLGIENKISETSPKDHKDGAPQTDLTCEEKQKVFCKGCKKNILLIYKHLLYPKNHLCKEKYSSKELQDCKKFQNRAKYTTSKIKQIKCPVCEKLYNQISYHFSTTTGMACKAKLTIEEITNLKSIENTNKKLSGYYKKQEVNRKISGHNKEKEENRKSSGYTKRKEACRKTSGIYMKKEESQKISGYNKGKEEWQKMSGYTKRKEESRKISGIHKRKQQERKEPGKGNPP